MKNPKQFWFWRMLMKLRRRNQMTMLGCPPKEQSALLTDAHPGRKSV